MAVSKSIKHIKTTRYQKVCIGDKDETIYYVALETSPGQYYYRLLFSEFKVVNKIAIMTGFNGIIIDDALDLPMQRKEYYDNYQDLNVSMEEFEIMMPPGCTTILLPNANKKTKKITYPSNVFKYSVDNKLLLDIDIPGYTKALTQKITQITNNKW